MGLEELFLDILSRLDRIEALLKDNSSSERFGDYLLRWFKTYKEPNNTPATNVLMKRHIDVIRSKLGNIELNKLSGDIIQSFLSSLPNTNTRSKICLILNGSLDKAYRLELIKRNPCLTVELTSHRVNHYRALTHEEQYRVYKLFERNVIYQHIFKILICTGMRIGEFLAVDSSCIDTDNRLIHVYHDVDTHTGQLQDRVKTQTSIRSIPYLNMLDDDIDYLLTYIRKYTITYNACRSAFKRAYESLKIKGANLHSLRHTFGCMCYQAGINEKTIQRMMGHSQLDVTMNTYVDVLGNGDSPFKGYFLALKEDLKDRPNNFWKYVPK